MKGARLMIPMAWPAFYPCSRIRGTGQIQQKATAKAVAFFGR
jgi:hypothetical protein